MAASVTPPSQHLLSLTNYEPMNTDTVFIVCTAFILDVRWSVQLYSYNQSSYIVFATTVAVVSKWSMKWLVFYSILGILAVPDMYLSNSQSFNFISNLPIEMTVTVLRLYDKSRITNYRNVLLWQLLRTNVWKLLFLRNTIYLFVSTVCTIYKDIWVYHMQGGVIVDS